METRRKSKKTTRKKRAGGGGEERGLGGKGALLKSAQHRCNVLAYLEWNRTARSL